MSVTQYYNGDTLAEELQFTVDLSSKVVAGIRLVQTRGKIGEGSHCYDDAYDALLRTQCLSEVEDTSTFRGGISSAFEFRLDHGKRGFIQFVATNDTGTVVSEFADLKTNRWLDEQSRNLEVDITLYSSSTKKWVSLLLDFSFDVTGFVTTSSLAQMVPVDPYDFDDVENIVRFAIELMFFGLSSGYFLWECTKIGLHYKFNIRRYWRAGRARRVLAWTTVLLSFLLIFLWVAFINHDDRRLILDLKDVSPPLNPDQFIEVEHLARILQYYFEVAAITVLFFVLRFIDFFRITPGGERLVNTLGHATPMLAWFLPVYLTIIVGSSLAGMILFGLRMDDWRTFGRALYRVFEINFGLYDTNALYDEAGSTGIFYVYLVTLVLVVLLLNAMLAIVVVAWDSYQHDVKAPASLYEFITTLQVHPKSIQLALNVLNGNGCVDRSTFISTLSKLSDDAGLDKQSTDRMADWLWSSECSKPTRVVVGTAADAPANDPSDQASTEYQLATDEVK